MKTNVEVRVIAAGGKFLGNDIGGAEVMVHDALTGALVAHGRVIGGSGDVATIMGQPRRWGTPVPIDQDPSVLRFALDLAQPRLLDIAAVGPLGSLQSARRATVQQWVAPGFDLTGLHGVQVVIPGQLVEIVAPATHTQLKSPGPVEIVANVAMMCGCPITQPIPTTNPPTPAQIAWWPVAQFEVTAIVYELASGAPVEVHRGRMEYAGVPSRFHAVWTMPRPGYYEIAVVARDRQGANTGVDRSTVFSPPPAEG